MTRTNLLLASSALAAIALAAMAPRLARAAKHGDDDDYYSLQDQETIRKNYTLSAAHKSLEVDNVWGSIEVTGTDSNDIQVPPVRPDFRVFHRTFM